MAGVAGFPAQRRIHWLAGLLQGLDFLAQDAVASCTHINSSTDIVYFPATREASSGNAAAGQRAQEKIEWATAGRKKRKGTQGRGEKAIASFAVGAVARSPGADPVRSTSAREGPAVSTESNKPIDRPWLRDLTSPNHPPPRPCSAPQHASWRAAQGCR